MICVRKLASEGKRNISVTKCFIIVNLFLKLLIYSTELDFLISTDYLVILTLTGFRSTSLFKVSSFLTKAFSRVNC